MMMRKKLLMMREGLKLIEWWMKMDSHFFLQVPSRE